MGKAKKKVIKVPKAKFMQKPIWDYDPPLQFDASNRIKRHPQIHPNHGKRLSFEELVYLCKYWDHDGQRKMAYALGRTEASLGEKVTKLRKEGDFKFYKNFDWWNEAFE